MKTKEQIRKYNKEYFARPEVIARAKVRNAQRKDKRAEYKKTEQGKEAEKRYRNKPETKEMIEWRRVKNRYGITREDYDIMLEKQGGGCGICGEKKENYHIDHCHKTLVVRGILCPQCNMGLGLYKDDTEILKNAIKYLDAV